MLLEISISEFIGRLEALYIAGLVDMHLPKLISSKLAWTWSLFYSVSAFSHEKTGTQTI